MQKVLKLKLKWPLPRLVKTFYAPATFVFSLLLFHGCNDSLDLNIPEPDDKIVIDGWIENGTFARVLLTKNMAYFSSIDSASIRALVLSRARVCLTDGKDTEILILRRNDAYFPPYIFEGNEIVGMTGKTYTLIASYGGKTATASTTIPAPLPLDTIYFVPNQENDSAGSLYVEFHDPAEMKNYYRLLFMREGIDSRFKSIPIQALDDRFFSGANFGFSFTPAGTSYINAPEDDFFNFGDTVDIKFCTMDKAQFDFWSGYQNEVMNATNPFASSLVGIQSNVQGTGLGNFGGFGVSRYKFIIPR